MQASIMRASLMLKYAKVRAVRAVQQPCYKQGTPMHLRRGSPAAQLSTSHKQRRLEFGKSHTSFSWQHVMFTDEVRIQLKYPGIAVGRRKWVRGDERYEAPKATKPLTVCFYAGITKWGITQPYFVTGTSEQRSPYTNRKGEPASNATQLEYHDVMMNGLLPDGHRMFQEHSLSEWYFQQDGAKAHSHAADTIAEFNSRYCTQVQLLKGWPASSPDLSPIENVWSLVKHEVAQKACKNIKQLKAAVRKALAGIKTETVQNLYTSMHRRMVEVREHDGDKINLIVRCVWVWCWFCASEGQYYTLFQLTKATFSAVAFSIPDTSAHLASVSWSSALLASE